MLADCFSYLAEELLTAEAAAFRCIVSAEAVVCACWDQDLVFTSRDDPPSAELAFALAAERWRKKTRMRLGFELDESFPVQTRRRDRVIQVESRTFPVGAVAA